jgi:hypothetical protein
MMVATGKRLNAVVPFNSNGGAMEGHANRIQVVGAGILFFLFLLLYSPNAKALTKDSSDQLLLEATQRVQDELRVVQAEQARRTQEYKNSLGELAPEFPMASQVAQASESARIQ